MVTRIKFLWADEGIICINSFSWIIQVLKDENGRLYKLLGERDEEMRILRKARDEEKKALAGKN